MQTEYDPHHSRTVQRKGRRMMSGGFWARILCAEEILGQRCQLLDAGGPIDATGFLPRGGMSNETGWDVPRDA